MLSTPPYLNVRIYLSIELKVAPAAVDLGGDVAAIQKLEALHADVSGRMEKALQVRPHTHTPTHPHTHTTS